MVKKKFNPQPMNKEKKEIVEIIKNIMFANDVDWVMSLENESVTYSKSWQLHKKIHEALDSYANKKLEEALRKLKPKRYVHSDEEPVVAWSDILETLSNK